MLMAYSCPLPKSILTLGLVASTAATVMVGISRAYDRYQPIAHLQSKIATSYSTETSQNLKRRRHCPIYAWTRRRKKSHFSTLLLAPMYGNC